MRSRTTRQSLFSAGPIRRCVLAVPVLALLLAGSSGCQLNRSFFQMDSNSRVPFFGVDLAPKWPGRGSSVDGVSRLQSEPVEVADAATPTPSAQPRSLALPQSDTVAPVIDESDSGPVEQFR
jgi:hypothetical protein